MAPEQGPDSKSKAEKTQRIASDEESGHINDNNQKDTLNTESIVWIYLLKKEQLVEQCRNAGIPTTGFTVAYLRKKLAEMIRTKRLQASSENLLREIEHEVRLSESTVIQDEREVSPVFQTDTRTSAEVISTVLKWNLQFSGESDLMEFLERVEELAECYQIHYNRLLPAMLGILSGSALKWYRVKRSEIRSWDEFRAEIQKFFLPKRFLSQIEQNFYNRRQSNRELAKDYILSMLTLARQHPELRKRDHLDRIYDGLRPEYRLYVRRSDFSSLDDLMSMTDDFEALKREERPQPMHTICIKKYNQNNTTLPVSCNGKDSNVKISGDNRYRVPIIIGGQEFQAVLDTGASETSINDQVTNSLITSGIPHTISEMANLNLVNLPRKFNVCIKYQNRSVELPVTEVPTLTEDVILGMDFLAASGIELRLGGNVIPASTKGQVSIEHSHDSRKGAKLDKRRPPDIKRRNDKAPPKTPTKISKSNNPKRQPSQPTRCSPHNITKKSSPCRPPPEARPSTIQNTQQKRPDAPSSTPTLNYLKSKRKTPIITEKIRLQQRQTTTPEPPLNRPKIQQRVAATNTSETVSINPIPVVIHQVKKKSPSSAKFAHKTQTRKDTADELLGGITVSRPATYQRHLQYLIRRPELPAVQVTILNRSFARIRCHGHEKVIRMTTSEAKKAII